MSVKLMARVWEIVLDRGERDVLLVMADHANDDGICWPSNALIAWKVDYRDVRSVRRIRRSLEAKGLVEILSGAQGGRAEGGTSGVSPKCQLHLDRGVKKPSFRNDDEEREQAGLASSEKTNVEDVAEVKGDKMSSLPADDLRGTSPHESLEIKEDSTARKGDLGARNGDPTARKEDTAMSSEPPRTTNEPPTPPEDAESVHAINRQVNEIMTLALRPKTHYPNRWKGHLARGIGRVLEEGFDYHVVLQATKDLEFKGTNPAALPSFVNQVQNGQTQQRSNGHRPFDAEDQAYDDVVVTR